MKPDVAVMIMNVHREIHKYSFPSTVIIDQLKQHVMSINYNWNYIYTRGLLC